MNFGNNIYSCICDHARTYLCLWQSVGFQHKEPNLRKKLCNDFWAGIPRLDHIYPWNESTVTNKPFYSCCKSCVLIRNNFQKESLRRRKLKANWISIHDYLPPTHCFIYDSLIHSLHLKSYNHFNGPSFYHENAINDINYVYCCYLDQL